MAGSAYIHIPFCKSKCKYCTFVSYTELDKIDDYINSLLCEISNNYKGEKISTLYFGGGTPSLVSPDLIKKIIQMFNFKEDVEITLEVNPDSATYDYLSRIFDIGINRVSIGSQTFNDEILQIIGRIHNSEQVEEAVKNAKKAGFKNISLDLIYGLPMQTKSILKADIDKILSLDIQHVSTYGLKIEEGSYFSKNMPKSLPGDDEQAEMYEYINKYFTDNSFFRYEISNFSKKGYKSRHNMCYWNCAEYYGFGVSAHGYLNGVRYSNSKTIEKYIKNPLKHETAKTLTQQEKLEEEIFLGFRKAEGIDVGLINAKYGISFKKKYSTVIDKYKDYIEETEKGYLLNLKGVLLSNIILSEFLG